MRILMIVSWLGQKNVDNTTGSFHLELVRGLQKENEVVVYFPFDSFIGSGLECDIEDGITVYRRAKSRNRLERLVRNIVFLWDYKQIAKEFIPDVIHSQVGLYAGWVGSVISRNTGIPHVATEHVPVKQLFGGGRKNYRKNYNRLNLVYSQAEYVTVVSDDLNGKLKKHFPNIDFITVYNGINRINEDSINNSICEYEQGAINCCIVAAMYDKEIKGFQYLFPALKKIIDSGYKIRLYICGGGVYLDYHIELAKKYGVYENVHFYGMLNKYELYGVVSEMDFCISASLFESAGVAVEEAMMLGKPLVVTKSGGASSLVTDDTAIVVEKKSVDALANGIGTIIANLDNYNSEDITNYATTNFAMDSVVKQYVDLYQSCVDKKKII